MMVLEREAGRLITPTIPTLLGLARTSSEATWSSWTLANGRPPLRRSYDTGAPVWSAHDASHDIPSDDGAQNTVCSIKPTTAAVGTYDGTSIPAGTFDSYLSTFAAAATSGARIALWHEPENNMTQAQYKAIYDHALPLMKAANSTIKVVVILTIGAFEGGKDGTAWISTGAGKPDEVLVDVYNGWSATNGRPWKTFQERVAPTFLSQIQPTGLRYGVAEVGCRYDSTIPTRRASWITDGWAYAKSEGMSCWCYWSEGEYDMDTDISSKAAWAAAVASPL